jgi:hypothetical protein
MLIASTSVVGFGHIGQAAAIMRAPFGLSNAEELASLVRAARFRDCAIQQKQASKHRPL